MLFRKFANARIMVKICAIVLVPVVGLTLVSAMQAVDKGMIVAEMGRTARLVDLAVDVRELAENLQREAAASARFISNSKQDSSGLVDLQRASAAAAAHTTERFKALDLASVSTELNDVMADGLAKADGIVAIRPQITARSVNPAQMNGTFTAAIVRLLDFSSFAPKAISDMEVTRSMRLYGDALQAAEASSAARANAASGFGVGRFELATFNTVSAFLARQAALNESIGRLATPAQREYFARTYAGPPVQETNRMIAVMMGAGPGGDVSSVTQDAWLKANAERMDLYRLVQIRFEDDLRSAAASVSTKSTRELWSQIGLSLVLLTATAAIAFFIARSITRPIHRLVQSMGFLAEGDIERDVPFTERRDELGGMARSVAVFKDNAVRTQALEAQAAETRLAAEQERARNEADRAEAAAQQARVVADLAAGLAGLADGDLTGRVHAFPEEYRKLEGDFNAAVGSLQETIQTIAGSSQTIRSGSGEISDAADELSRRTEQQAASLEETAAALDQVTATVRKTAAGAKHASELVGSARGDAERSGKVVQDAAVAMRAIEQSAEAISQIIGVINEVAFQTNLLALNAGVEAARAGDAGRGFAVVASEVRALSQRTAEAAKEIRALIATSTSQVATGVMLVSETGKTLSRIVEQVTEITGIVSDIAGSAHEQAIGLQEVNTAMNQMDQMTQQNVAMVEASTTANHSLASEAEHLATLIGRFRTGDEGGSHAATPSPTRRATADRPVSVAATRGSLARKQRPA